MRYVILLLLMLGCTDWEERERAARRDYLVVEYSAILGKPKYHRIEDVVVDLDEVKSGVTFRRAGVVVARFKGKYSFAEVRDKQWDKAIADMEKQK